MAAVVTREDVKEALESLHDNVRLSQAQLAELVPSVRRSAALDERAEALRSLLLESIEALRPRRQVTGAGAGQARSRLPFGSAEARSYDVLTLRYLERLPVAQIEVELSLGRRQIYRDLEEAEERLTAVLASWAEPAADEGSYNAGDPLTDELAARANYPSRVELRKLLPEVVKLVEPLATRADATVVVSTIGEADFVLADRAILKQVLVQLLCCAIQGGGADDARAATSPGKDSKPRPSPKRIELVLNADRDAPLVEFSIHFRGDSASIHERLSEAGRIAAACGMSCRFTTDPGSANVLSLTVHRGEPVSVLVVEDNPGAIELYRRYLSATGWQLRGVSDPRIAFDVVRDARPDLLILDVMMPWLDGWSVLAMLRDHPDTASVPVVICSVVQQPELATALGARAYLTKPVSQADFLAVLRACVDRPSDRSH
ncbi:MAG: response regulator [Anaerolineae bacterium]